MAFDKADLEAEAKRRFQDNAVAGLPAEAKVNISWEEVEVALNGEAPALLRRPILTLDNPGYGPFDPELMTSIRVAQPMIGLGLLEAIHPGDIFALEDPDDENGDGVSGRVAVATPAIRLRVFIMLLWPFGIEERI